MLSSSFVALVTLLGAQAAHAAPSASISGTVGNYTIVPLTWIGKVHPGGPDVTLQGDMKEIVNQIKALNPNFEFLKPSEAHLKAREAELVARDSYPSYVLCNRKEFDDARLIYIVDGENYLDGVPGLCTLGPGAGKCGRVSCSWASAIYFCNDVDHAQYINCAEIAYYSRASRAACGLPYPEYRYAYFNAQRFRTDTGYSVLDAYSNC